jgi:hypothetical protein
VAVGVDLTGVTQDELVNDPKKQDAVRGGVASTVGVDVNDVTITKIGTKDMTSVSTRRLRRLAEMATAMGNCGEAGFGEANSFGPTCCKKACDGAMGCATCGPGAQCAGGTPMPMCPEPLAVEFEIATKDAAAAEATREKVTQAKPTAFADAIKTAAADAGINDFAPTVTVNDVSVKVVEKKDEKPAPTKSSDDDNDAKVIGGAVGGAVGGLLLIAIAYFMFCMKPKQASSDPVPGHGVEKQLEASSKY